MVPALLLVVLGGVAEAAPLPDRAVPPELAGWVDWVRWEHPEWACPRRGSDALCVWPGRLAVDADADGASLRLDVHLDAAGRVVLPGGAGAWPVGLVVDGRAAPVLAVGEGGDARPALDLPAGDHRASWTLPWAQRPTALALPPDVGLVELTLDGEAVPFPQVDGDGRLRLGASEAEGPAENRLELDVFRRVQDGVPVVVTTHVDLRVAGQPREVDLGAVLVPGTRPVKVDADLPVRITPEGTVVVQVRPGRFALEVEGVSSGPVSVLAPPALPAPWPEQEVWSFQADDRVRTVDLSGPAGVDPARTSMPEGWRALPAWLVEPDVPLQITELRRGEPVPPPNALALDRELWLDLDGRGWTLKDRLTGSQSRDWRLDVAAPSVLGHVEDHGVGQVVTTADGRQGVEVRATGADVVGESRVEGAVRTLPAVGWHTDVQRLGARVHLPPGWELIYATGVDDVGGLVPWSLFDLFYVLVLALGLGRLLGWRWGLVALLGLGLARHEAGAPDVVWAVLLVLLAVERVASGRGATITRTLRNASLVVLFGILAVFATAQVRDGVFPQLGSTWEGGGSFGGPFSSAQRAVGPALEEYTDELKAMDMPAEQGSWEGDAAGYALGMMGGSRGEPRKLALLTKQADPAAVVQTGPGVPTWSWRTYHLAWSGPVGEAPTMTLWLLPPLAGLGLALVRLALLLLLALRVAGARLVLGRGAVAAAAVALALVLVPGAAEAAPDPSQLDELARRLNPAPACGDACVDAPSSTWTVRGDRLVVDVQLDAAVHTSWPLPGPATTWVPAVVSLDGVPTSRLRRAGDGALHVAVPAGVHRLRLEGALPPADVLALQLLVPPRRVTFEGDGWSAEGLKADGTVGGTLQLVRTRAPEAGRSATSAENLTPWVEVRRHLDLGLPWRVRTEVVRVGPSAQPLALRVPLLPGESITDEDVLVEGAEVVVTLGRDVAERSWLSSLDAVERLALRAPEGVPWTEVWTVSCSPIFSCAAEGPAPVSHTREERWWPEWRPWPGEEVAVLAARPDAVVGQTLTVDAATMAWTPGLRLGEGSISLTARSSQGGQLALTLPHGAELRSVTVDGSARPLQLRDGSALAVPLRPGAQDVVVSWQQPHDVSFWDRAPEVRVGAPLVNATVEITPTSGRWILGLRGPPWGPVPLWWLYVGQVVVAAALLARVPYAPLRAHQWLLLGLGMTQVPVAVPILVVLAFFALGARRRHPLQVWWAFDVVQLGLVLTTLVALGLLYAAIHAGLLVQPDMQVEGNGSSDHLLRWYVDRTDGTLPAPVVISLPLWTFRVAMLAWSLWLAWSLVGWAKWAWACWTEGGMWKGAARA